MKHRRLVCFAALGAFCPFYHAAAQSSPAVRQPAGIYARYTAACSPAKNQTVDQCITATAAALLSNPAISGINAELNWKDLNPSSGSYDWSELDDIFGAVDAWNEANPGKLSKTVQIDVNPGFHSPQWVFDNLPSCDPMFGAPPEANPDGTLNMNYKPYNPPNPSLVPNDCGYATFVQAELHATQPLSPLPLPWNPYYKSAWTTFVQALAQKYGSNPDLVSVTIAGPTASSAEMILPNEKTDGTGDPANFYKWNYLLALTFPASYQNSDQAFIEAWEDAIDVYSQAFSGLTLVITTGSGLPNFLMPELGVGQAQSSGKPFPNYSVPPGFEPACGGPDLTKIMDCAAEETVVAYLADPLHGGPNLKSSQENGLGAGGVHDAPLGGGDLDAYGIKWLAETSAGGVTQLPGSNTEVSRVFGGLQSGGPITDSQADIQSNGCNLPIGQVCPGLTAEQAIFNFLATFFDGTPVGASYGPGMMGGAYGLGVVSGKVPLNYIQLYDVDILYANANACDIPGGACTKEPVTNGAGKTNSMTFQDVLEMASQQILQIAELPQPPAVPSGGVVPGTIQPGEWVSIFGTNLSATTANWNGDFPVSLGGSSATIDGKAAFLSYVGPGQINLQAPNDTAIGPVPLVITTATGSVKSTVTLAQDSPMFFLQPDGKHVAGIIPGPNGSYSTIGPTGNSLGYPTVAAQAGQTVELFGTGFGPTNPPVPAGQAFSGAAPTTNTVTVVINKVSVTPTFAGLSGAGLYQINVTIPSGLGTGDVSLQATVEGAQTPSGVLISLQ